MSDDTARRLGRLVAERREHLGRSRRQIALMGGPTEPTLLKIERGHAVRMNTATMRKLDAAIAWEPGSTQRIWAGGAPTPLRPDGAIALAPTHVLVPAEVIGQLVEIAREIAEHRAEAPMALHTASQRLDACVQPLYTRYVTQLLETNRRHDGALGPLLTLLGPFLDSPADPGSGDWEDARYRRWLAGVGGDIDEPTRARFAARLRESS